MKVTFSLQDQNGILQQPGNPHFIYDDPRARRKFEQARARNEELLRELEHWGMREMQAQEYYESLKGNQYLRFVSSPGPRSTVVFVLRYVWLLSVKVCFLPGSCTAETATSTTPPGSRRQRCCRATPC